MNCNKIDIKTDNITKYEFTGKDIAKALGVHYNTVNRWAGYGCPCIHTSRDIKGKGARRRFSLEEVIEWLKARPSNQDSMKGGQND